MTRRDGAERLLSYATSGLPSSRTLWGDAMRAELAWIEDPRERRAFARSASLAAFAHGHGIRIAGALIVGTLVAVIAVITSRLQLEGAQPGLLSVTVPVPALLLFLAAFGSAALARSFRVGLETGALAFLASFAAVVGVLAVEGQVWMDRHGVFILDGDPPKNPVGATDVILDVFTTGMWIGHVVFWAPWIVLGATLGARVIARKSSTVSSSPRAVGAIPAASSRADAAAESPSTAESA